MPCSGLKSATSFTSFAAEQQVDRRRAVARAAGVVGDAARRACRASGAKPSARSTSMPVSTGGVGAGDRQRPAGAEVARRSSVVRVRQLAGTSVSADADDRRDARAQRRDVALAVGMDAVRQEDDEHARRRIDPERRAGEAGVAERSDRQQLAAVATRSSSRCPSRARARSARRPASPASSSSRRSAATGSASPP